MFFIHLNTVKNVIIIWIFLVLKFTTRFGSTILYFMTFENFYVAHPHVHKTYNCNKHKINRIRLPLCVGEISYVPEYRRTRTSMMCDARSVTQVFFWRKQVKYLYGAYSIQCSKFLFVFRKSYRSLSVSVSTVFNPFQVDTIVSKGFTVKCIL